MKVRWGLDQLPELLAELNIEKPFLVASPRWEPPAEVAGRWSEIPSDRIDEAARAAEGADGLLAVGGGSAIDLAKAISVETGLPVVSVPTTYSGAEWTPSFGVRDHDRRMRGGGSGANLAGIVYEPELTLGLPERGHRRDVAERARAHGRGALRRRAATRKATARRSPAPRSSPSGYRESSSSPTTSRHAVTCSKAPCTPERRWHPRASASATRMAQALGGRYGLPHGAMNALSLPQALRFNEPVAGEEIARFGEAMGADDPVGRVRGARAPRWIRAPT